MSMSEMPGRRHAAIAVATNGQGKFRIHLSHRGFGAHFGSVRGIHFKAHVSAHIVDFHVLIEQMGGDFPVDGAADEAQSLGHQNQKIDAQVIE